MGWWSAPRPGRLYPEKDPVAIVQAARWAPGPFWRGGKSRPDRDSIPDGPARSQSLYRLSYPAHQSQTMHTQFHENRVTCSKVLVGKQTHATFCLVKLHFSLFFLGRNANCINKDDLTPSLFWDITRRRFTAGHRRFGAAYRFHLHRSYLDYFTLENGSNRMSQNIRNQLAT